MAEEQPPLATHPEVSQHSLFIIGSVSEDNSEDEIGISGKLDLSEEKERSLSPNSISSDTLSDLGLSQVDGISIHIRFLLPTMALQR
nr:PREDICTED: acetyl-CoA carboxylase 1-like [Latimeria chalumnae]|eukprot:XP_014343179.1 PREDICTED: acetyl-CoA carboxylase 1-like [Latimeria chalumnae]